MPTYEYRCTRCRKRVEIFQPITSPPKRRCPKCKCKLERLIGTGAGFLFKGSGFYITDYRSPSYKEAAKKESGTMTSAKKTETKPAHARSEERNK